MQAPAFRISPVYDLLLRGTTAVPYGLYHLQLATADQLTRLYYRAGTLTTVKARLKDLTDHGYIQADTIPTKRARSPYYYAMGQKGIRYLADTGVDVSDAFRADKDTNRHSLFIEHTLELNDVLIAAIRLQQADNRYHLEHFIHERILKRQPYKVGEATLIPDAFLDFRFIRPDSKQLCIPILLEHDRGTGEQHYFRRKIRAYIALLATEAYKELFGVQTVTVAITTFAGISRLQQMYAWTQAELKERGQPNHIAGAFRLASLTRPPDSRRLYLEPCWYTPASSQPIALLA